MVIWVLGSIFWSPTFPIHISRHTFLHLCKKWSSLYWPLFLCVHKWLWVWRKLLIKPISLTSFFLFHTYMYAYIYLFPLNYSYFSPPYTHISPDSNTFSSKRKYKLTNNFSLLSLNFMSLATPHRYNIQVFLSSFFYKGIYMLFCIFFFLSQHHYMEYDSLIDPFSWWQALDSGFCYYEHCPSTHLCICTLICCCLYLCGIDSQE